MDLNQLVLDVTDPSDFPLEILKKLDSAFRCTICKEFFDAPVSLTQCGHTFCSLCIRTELPNKPECPLCKKPTKEVHLIRNVMLAEAVEAWCKSRKTVLNLAKDHSVPPSRSSKKRKRDVEHLKEGSDGKGPDSPSTSRRKLEDDSDEMIYISSSPEPDGEAAGSRFKRQKSDEVPCPLCSQRVMMSSINSHMDSNCKKFLAEEEKVDRTKNKAAWNSIFKPTSKRKTSNNPQDAEIPTTKLAKVSYGTLTLSGLKKLLSDFGLSTTGDKDTLITRHERWIAIYNANLDRAHPKSCKDTSTLWNVIFKQTNSDLVGELKIKLDEVEEAAGRPGPKKISDEKDWAKKNQDQFKLLIAQAKDGSRRRKEGNTPSPNQYSESCSEKLAKTADT